MRTSIKSIGGLLLVAFTLGSRVAQAQVLSRSNPLANAHGLWISIESQDFQSMKSIDFLGSGKVAIQGLGEGTFEFLKNQQYRLRFDGNGVKLCQVAVTSTGNQEMTIIAVADENGKIVDKCELGKIAFKFDSDATSEIQEKGAMGQGAPEDLQALSCRASEVGDAIRQGKLVVPKTLYHFGGKSSLLKNVENNGILESDWDNHIMSGKSRFDLKPFRRGFYGGADTNDISLYSFVKPDDYPFNKSARLEWSWLTKFTLRDECRTPDRVTTLVGLPKNPVFQNWFLKTLNKEGFQSVQAIADVCFVGDDFNPDTVEETSSHKELHPCEKILNDFLVDTGAKIVQDNGNSRSFYIRDRSCIESMSGSSQEILQIFSDEKSRFLFGTKCPSDLNPTGQPSGGDYFLFLIVSAISDLRGNVEAQIVANLLQASRIATADAYNFKNNAPDFLEALKRCQTKKNLSEFNATLDAMLKDGYPQIFNRELALKFRPICR